MKSVQHARAIKHGRIRRDPVTIEISHTESLMQSRAAESCYGSSKLDLLRIMAKDGTLDHNQSRQILIKLYAGIGYFVLNLGKPWVVRHFSVMLLTIQKP